MTKDTANGSESQDCLRAIKFAYNPVPDGRFPDPVSFPYFETAETQDTIFIDPKALGIPWTSSFPGCRQSKHWGTIEEELRNFLNMIREVKTGNNGSSLDEMRSPWSKKEKALLETAVTVAIYAFPEASRTRAPLMATLELMSFMHDDIIELRPDEDVTIVDDVMGSWPDKVLDDQSRKLIKCAPFGRLAEDILAEHEVLGEELLKAYVTWQRHTHGYKGTAPVTFPCLRDYLIYRFKDIGAQSVLATIKIGYDVNVSASDTYILTNIIRLFLTHICLINDLYSYDKERREADTLGMIIVNAVHVVKECDSLSAEDAKLKVRDIIWKTEREMYEECLSLQRVDLLDEDQKRFVRGLLECAAGQVFFCTVAGRYGGTPLASQI